MSYSVNINQGNNTVSIPSRKALAGYTLKLVLDRGGSSAPVEITSGLTVSGQSVVANVAGRLSDYSGSDYTLMGTKNGSTEVLQNGHIYSAKQTTSAMATEVTVSGPVTVANPVNTVGVSGTVPVSGTVNTVPPVAGTLVGTIQNKIREEFRGSTLDSNSWDLVQTGPGQTVSVTTSVLSIASGTTANATTIIRSKKSFTGAYRTMFVSAASLMSNRIANHSVELRMTNADGSSYAAWVFNGTTATNGVIRSQAGGVLGPDQTIGSISSTAGTSIYEVENFIDEVYFHSRAADSTNARATSAVKNRLTPDPNEEMFVEIRVVNGSTAPASSVTLNIDSILIQDISELTTEITGGRGAGGASQAIPVVQQGAGVTTNVAVANNPILNLNSGDTTITTVALAANGTFAQSSVDRGNNASIRVNRARFVVSGAAAALGSIATLFFEQSTDGTTWRETWRMPLPNDGNHHTFEVPLYMRYTRFRAINGTTAQTAFVVIERALQFDGPTDQKLNLSIPLTPPAGQALAASTNFTGPTMDLGANHMWDKLRASAYSDQASGASGFAIQQSVDGSNWLQWNTTTITAGGSFFLESPVVLRYARVVVGNSTTPATALRVIVSLVSL